MKVVIEPSPNQVAQIIPLPLITNTDSGVFLQSENSLMTVLSYFDVHGQLEMQKVSKRLRFLVSITQESRRFRVSYFTQEYTDTRRLLNAHQNLGYSPRI